MRVGEHGSTDGREKSALASQRAKAVADYLIEKGVPAGRVVTKTNTAKKNAKTEAARKALRTVAFTLTSKKPSVLEDKLNAGTPLNVKITPARKYQRGDSKLVDATAWKPGTYTLEKDGRHVFVKITQVEGPKPKELSEARGIATSDYQAYLEKQWLEELRQKYPVQVNQAEVNKLIKKP